MEQSTLPDLGSPATKSIDIVWQAVGEAAATLDSESGQVWRVDKPHRN